MLASVSVHVKSATDTELGSVTVKRGTVQVANHVTKHPFTLAAGLLRKLAEKEWDVESIAKEAENVATVG